MSFTGILPLAIAVRFCIILPQRQNLSIHAGRLELRKSEVDIAPLIPAEIASALAYLAKTKGEY
jgi:hypothetical protein